MAALLIYPRRYFRRVPAGSGVIRANGDPEVNKIFDDFMAQKLNTQSFAKRAEVLVVAGRLLHNFVEWAKDQQANANLRGYNYDFLVDTINFINSGKRKLSVMNWHDLVSEDDFPTHGNNVVRAVPLDLGMFENDSAYVVTKWCSRDGGFEDMVQSLYLIFGRSRESGKD